MSSHDGLIFEGPVCLPAQKRGAGFRLLGDPEVRSGDYAASWLGFPAGNCNGRRVTAGIRRKSGSRRDADFNSSYRKCSGVRHSVTPEHFGAGAFPIKPKDLVGIPLHLDVPVDPARRCAVVGRLDFNAAIQVQADRLAAVAERQHEQLRAPVFAARRIADHRASAVIDLDLLAVCGLDYRTSFRPLLPTELADESLDALIAAGFSWSSKPAV